MAPPPQQRPQKRHFYSGRWTKSHDISFINALCWKAEKGFKQDNPRCPNKMALQWEFKQETYAWHLERLRTRYLIFKSILENPRFHWDVKYNIVHAPYDAWVALIRANPFADAYIKRGEPQWGSLKLIFESNEEGRWGYGYEIVTISSGDEADGDGYANESFSEEDIPNQDSVIDLATTDSE